MASGKAARRQQHVERERERAEVKKFEKKVTWLSLGLLIAGPLLGIGAGVLGAAEFYPSDYMMVVGLSVMGAFMGLGLMVAACAGLYLLGGWKATPFGVLFVGGFGVMVYGVAEADNGWRDLGAILLSISTGSFWAAPALSPARRRKPASAPG